MNDLGQQKVLKSMGWIMIGCFAWVTYFNFQGFFRGIVDLFATLPLWWFLIILPIFALAVMWSISLGEQEIKKIEQELENHKRVIIEMQRKLRLIRYDMMALSPLDFEYYCADLFKTIGYTEVEVTAATRDGGKDIIARDPSGIRVYIECKQYRNQISREKIQKLHSAMTHDRVSKGIFITTSDFSQPALEYAEECNIECLNGERLSQFVMIATKEQRVLIEKVI